VHYTQLFKSGIKPDPILTVSEYADAKRVLPRSSTHEYGRYRSSRTPYIVEIMDCLSIHSPVRRVVVKKPTQIGCTDGIGNNWLFYIADICPGPAIMALPTVELSKRHVKGKVQPSLREMESLREKIRSLKDKRSEETMIKEFPGGFWQFIGSNSAAGLRSVSVRYLIKDDLDGWEQEAGTEGDPSDIIDKRTDSYGASAKILEMSTPTERELSRIDKSFDRTDQCYYCVPCPYCNHEQRLVWGGEGHDTGLVFDKNNLDAGVHYRCEKCHELIPEYKKTYMLDNGIWVPTHPEIKLERGFSLNSLYSPVGWVSWRTIVDEFLKSKKYPSKLKVWVNTRLGQSWEEKGERPEWSVLRSRAETYQTLNSTDSVKIPERALLLTAGVDVQQDRLAVLITGWGRGEECWILFWNEIFGDTERPQVWAELSELIRRPYTHESGIPLHIVCPAIDSGDKTQIVYNYVRSHGSAIATKGMSTPGKPIIGRPSNQDVNYKGEKQKNGVQLWPVGTDTAKGLIYPRLKITEPGPGMIHFPMGLGDDFYLQLTAEKKVTRYRKGFPVTEWVLPSGRRNEVLDCFVLCLAAAIKVGMNRINWDNLESSIKSTLVTQPVYPGKRRIKIKSPANNLTLRNN